LGQPGIGRSYPRVRTLVGLVETLPVAAARRVMASLAGTDAAPRRPARTEVATERGATVPAARTEPRSAPVRREAQPARKAG
ncbi:hypothetical protein P7D22_20875, partial [Lichenihabitans sp. Uapishka_5]|uniref:hypothetical protein n=1 Tax=Lichenihabitans sp. Uapishka_5 TaxID=3037302 RepID=UPI0029E7F7BB